VSRVRYGVIGDGIGGIGDSSPRTVVLDGGGDDGCTVDGVYFELNLRINACRGSIVVAAAGVVGVTAATGLTGVTIVS
jgi:hypothetical protein